MALAALGVLLWSSSCARAAGVEQTITYAVVETRGVVINLWESGMGGTVAWSGTASTVTVELSGRSSVEVSEGRAISLVRPGFPVPVYGGAPMTFRLEEPTPGTLTFTVSAA